MRKSSKIIITLAALIIIGVPLLLVVLRAVVPGKQNDVCTLTVSSLSTVRVGNIPTLRIVKGSESDREYTMTVSYDSRLTKLSLDTDADTINLVHLNADGQFFPIFATLTIPPGMTSLTVQSVSDKWVNRYCDVKVEGLSMPSLTIMTPDNISIESCEIDTLSALMPADYNSYRRYSTVHLNDTRVGILNISDLVQSGNSDDEDRGLRRYLSLNDNAVVDTINAL